MLADALRGAGGTRPTRIILDDIVEPRTLGALRQGADFSTTPLYRTISNTVAELGGRIGNVQIMREIVGRGQRKFDAVIQVFY